MRQLLSKSSQLHGVHNSLTLPSTPYLCRKLGVFTSFQRQFATASTSTSTSASPSTQFYARQTLYQKPETDEDRQRRVKTLFGDIPSEDLAEVIVDGKKVRVPKGVTVLQACEAAGVNIPRFCYHDRLSIAGNCRMCLVEVEKAKKPVASCANPIMPGMVIKTDTNMVKFAREGVVEFLLANHPLDCPICDQGGECDLQDIALTFGSMEGRYLHEDKRCVEDKDLGPFIKTVMNRCIHCTRCIRFSDEIAGVDCLGTTGRGNVTEVGTYIDTYFDSEISGNVIDLCPVGALTNKACAFKVRPWDLTIYESIDIMESTQANIVLDTRFNELIRIKPRLNEDINEEWISDKTRFCVDGVKRQRLDMPLVKNKESNVLEPATWPDALAYIYENIAQVNGEEMMALSGDLQDIESMLALKDFMNKLGCNNVECRMDGTRMDCDIRNNYLFNASITGIEQCDTLLLIGCNPRMEVPLINTRIRKAYLNGLDVFVIGNAAKLNYEFEMLGDNLSVLQDIIDGNSEYCDILAEAQQPCVIFGMNTLQGDKYEVTMSLVRELIAKYPAYVQGGDNDNAWNGISFLQTRAARNGGLDIGFVNNNEVDLDGIRFLYCLGGDEYYRLNEIAANDKCFVVYQGSHGDAGARIADVVLPGCSWVEKNGTYVNIDGRVQRSKAALTAPGQARNDWQIIRALSEICDVQIEYDTIEGLRERMFDIAPHLENVDSIEANMFNVYDERICYQDEVDDGDSSSVSRNIMNQSFEKYYSNYFATDPISRSSLVLKKAAKDLPNSANSWC